MTTMNVLSITIKTTKQPLSALRGELKAFLDFESIRVFETLFDNGQMQESKRFINQVREIPFKESISFVEIADILNERGLVPLSPSSAIDFLHALKGKENVGIRRSFFESGGVTLLSTEPILIDNQLNYLIIGQNSASEKEDGQRLFSVRLLPAMQMFPHKLYRVIAAMV